MKWGKIVNDKKWGVTQELLEEDGTLYDLIYWGFDGEPMEEGASYYPGTQREDEVFSFQEDLDYEL